MIHQKYGPAVILGKKQEQNWLSSLTHGPENQQNPSVANRVTCKTFSISADSAARGRISCPGLIRPVSAEPGQSAHHVVFIGNMRQSS
jgi:hypothetical protein